MWIAINCNVRKVRKTPFWMIFCVWHIFRFWNKHKFRHINCCRTSVYLLLARVTYKFGCSSSKNASIQGSSWGFSASKSTPRGYLWRHLWWRIHQNSIFFFLQDNHAYSFSYNMMTLRQPIPWAHSLFKRFTCSSLQCITWKSRDLKF